MSDKIVDIDAKILQLEQEVGNSELESIEVTPSGMEQEWWSTTEAMTISSVILSFGFFIILVMAYLIHKGKNPEDILRLFGTVIIIILAVFLVVAGYSDKQIAPVMGLLGTIAGYLLGKNVSPSKTKTDKKS